MEPGYRDLAERMEIPDTAESLLDLGGGDGRLAIALAKLNPGLKHLVSVDISEDMTRRAQRRIAKAGLASTIAAECEDMHALSYSDERFDAVVSFGALHHARQPEVVLTEAYRLLRRGGRICIIDGHGRPSFAAIRESIRRFGGSLIAAVAYWCGSKDCLPSDQIANLVPSECLPGIEVSFNEVLAIVSGTKKNRLEQDAAADADRPRR